MLKKFFITSSLLILGFILSSCTKQYTVTYETRGGKSLDAMEVEEGESLYTPEPTRNGYTFDGWYEDEELTEEFDETKMPSKDITLYAKWSVNRYTVKFESNGGTTIDDQTYEAGSDFSLPTPERDGYIFQGWSTNERWLKHEGSYGTDFRFYPQSLTSDMTVYAFWKYKFDFEYKDEDSGWVVTIYWGSDDHIKVPSEYNGDPVTAINSTFNTSVLNRSKTLESITIPDSITRIEDTYFRSESKTLKEIKVDSNNTHFKSIEGVLYNNVQTTLLRYPEAKSNETYIIPDTVTSIESQAFRGAQNLESVTLPDTDTIITIGEHTFADLPDTFTIYVPETEVNDYKTSWSDYAQYIKAIPEN